MSPLKDYSFEPLNQYFKQLNNHSVKEVTMFKDTLAYWKEKFKLLWTKPVEFVDNETKEDEDYWAFEIRTSEWVCDGEVVPVKHDVIVDTNDDTWFDVLDQILDVMGKHYGYNIKEQVYYSVKFPYNEFDDDTGKPVAGYGRTLNDAVLQQLLLAFPEVYELSPYDEKKNNGVFEV